MYTKYSHPNRRLADKLSRVLWTIFFVSGILLLVVALLGGCKGNGSGSTGGYAASFFAGKGGSAPGSGGPDSLPPSNGSDGYITLFIHQDVETDILICESQSGQFIQYGLDLNRDFALEQEEITDGFVLCNGNPGSDGQLGKYVIEDIVDPCGTQRDNGLDEVLILFENGDVMGQTSQRLVLFPSGEYITHDGTNCHFTVTEDGLIDDQYTEEE